jgi:cold shock CspA family protein
MKLYGELIRWDSLRGFGFIEADDRQNYFVHQKQFDLADLEPTLGMKLAFDLRPNPRHEGKLQAHDLELIDYYA